MLRSQFFGAELFGEPAWDILLDLYDSELQQVRIKVSSIGVESGLPATTTLRWLKVLEGKGLIQRREDPNDARRVFVSLRPMAIATMETLFGQILAQLPDVQSLP